MIIDFSQHNQPEFDFAHVYSPQEIDLADETARVSGEIKISGTARRSSEIARLTGKLSGDLEIACSRCLLLTDFALDAFFDVDFVTAENYGSVNNETELTQTDLSVSLYNGDQINLDELVLEQILLNLPMHQLCREQCAGLCLTCGANKNINPCDCGAKDIDPRWSALKELKNGNR